MFIRVHTDSLKCVIYPDGTKEWYTNGQRHRTDGPAIEWANGDKEWWFNGQLHRTNGPAIEYANGTKWWYFKGERISKEEFYSNEFQVKIVMES
jgi:hypothetical protein